jgi:NADH pyrophosphatase NudC (nudix superfamily)
MSAEKEKAALLADEVLLVRNSGEIPEVAMYSSMYYLTGDPDGPSVSLEEQDLALLRAAVISRYRAIMLRDLEPDNRDKRSYRGLARCIVNWRRFRKFCGRIGHSTGPMRAEVGQALSRFLGQELQDVMSGKRQTAINCTFADLALLLAEVGLQPVDLPEGWELLWPDQ